jgi:hypothetical protein
MYEWFPHDDLEIFCLSVNITRDFYTIDLTKLIIIIIFDENVQFTFSLYLKGW